MDEKSEEKAKVSLCECAGIDYGIGTEAALLKEYGEEVMKDCDKFFEDENFEDKARECQDLAEIFENLDELDNMMEGYDPNMPPNPPGDVDCEQFLRDYEAFVNEYIDLSKKMKANPKDMSLIKQFSEISINASEFMNSAMTCSANPDYATKFEAMSERLSKAAEGL